MAHRCLVANPEYRIRSETTSLLPARQAPVRKRDPFIRPGRLKRNNKMSRLYLRRVQELSSISLKRRIHPVSHHVSSLIYHQLLMYFQGILHNACANDDCKIYHTTPPMGSTFCKKIEIATRTTVVLIAEMRRSPSADMSLPSLHPTLPRAPHVTTSRAPGEVLSCFQTCGTDCMV